MDHRSDSIEKIFTGMMILVPDTTIRYTYVLYDTTKVLLTYFPLPDISEYPLLETTVACLAPEDGWFTA